MNKIDTFVSQTLKEQSRSINKIHNSIKAMKNCDEFKHIKKYCSNNRKRRMDYIYGGNGIEDAKYTYTSLLIHQINLYKYLISYLKRKNTEGWASMNGVMLVQTVIKKIIRDIKVSNLDTVGWSDTNSLKYTEIDRKKMEWYCYNNLLDIINRLYNTSDIKNVNTEELYKEAGLL